MSSEFTLRRGNQNADDAEHYAKLASLAADGLFELIYGSKDMKLLEHLYLQDDTTNNYLRTYFVEDGGTILGKVTSFSSHDKYEYEKITNNKIKEFLGFWRTFRMYSYFVLLGFMGIDIKGAQQDELYIESIAIYPEHQGKGLSKILMNKVVDIAETSGITKISLEVDKKNYTAIAVYKKFGFEIDPKTRKKKIMRMIRELD